MRSNPMKFGVIAFLACLLAFVSQAFPQEEEGEYVGWSQGLKYTVQKGDTLWDISEKFFDTPAMWPELWKRNPHIRNPHWIDPGTIVNIFVQDGVAFIPKPEPPAPEPAEPAGEKADVPKPPAFRFPGIEKAGFVRKPLVDSLGEIVDISDDKFMASTGDTVYVTLADNSQPYAEGDRFTVWRPLETIRDGSEGKFRKKEVGIQHWIVGEAICATISNGVMRAKVENSYRAVKIGDRLMPYRNLSSDIVFHPGIPGMEGAILAEENDKEIFGEGDVVFINKGSDDGIAPGQVYSLFYDKEFKSKGKQADGAFQELAGKLIVLIAQDNNSTALITESDTTIRVGACFRTQELLER